MTYSAKLLRNENGHIFLNNKIDAGDFHAGFYTSVPLNNGMKFRRLFQSLKINDLYCSVIPALKEDNTLVGIYDGGITVSDLANFTPDLLSITAKVIRAVPLLEEEKV